MHRLVPEFILRQHERKQTHGTFAGVSLFIDVSGFTAITEILIQKERSEAEVLAEAITNIFTPLQEIIHSYGGFVANFAGDAFSAIFRLESPDEIPCQALLAANHIQQIMGNGRQLDTPYGSFELRLRLGMAYGEIEWGILNSEHKSIFYFRGEAIERSNRAENSAKPGEWIISPRLLDKVAALVNVRPAGGDYWVVTSLRTTAMRNVPPLNLPASTGTEFPAESFSAFFPPDIVSAEQRGEFRPVVSVFLNISGNPGHENLQRLTSRFLAFLEQYGGYLCRLDFIDKGCRLLLFWGIPHSTEKNLERALNFVLLAKIAASTPIRAGISYGMAYAGFVGGEFGEEYTCYSSRVNLAARLMSLAPWGEIWLGPECARHAKSNFHTHPAGLKTIKGFAQPQPVHRLNGAAFHHSVFFQGEMIGRHVEVQRLHRNLQPIFEHRFAGVGYVYGMPGQGKSRLVYELSHQLGTTVTWLEAQASELIRVPLNPFLQILKHYFKQEENASVKTRRAAFENGFELLIQKLENSPSPDDTNLKTELIRTRSVLAAIVGLREAGSLWEQLDARGRYENTFYAIKALILAESRLRPLVLFIDDGQYLDADSNALLSFLTSNVENYPFIVLSALRYTDTGKRPAFDLNNVPSFRIDLEALDVRNARMMAYAQLGAAVSGSVLDSLMEKTGGIPFFVEQMLLDLQERQALTFTGEAWDFAPGEHANVPDTINAILIARIDRLSAEVQEVVKTAAVLGHEFEVRVLSQMLENSQVSDHLNKLVHDAEAQGVWLAKLKNLQYIFKHAMLRDTAYQMQLASRRRLLHALALNAFESLYAEDLSPHYAKLVFHARQAGDTGKLHGYLILAGDQAASEYKNTAAMEFYRELLPMLHSDSERIRSLQKLGNVLEFRGHWVEAEKEYKTALLLAEQTGEQVSIAECEKELGILFQKRGDFDASVGWLEQAQACFRSLGDQRAEAETLAAMGNTFGRKGEYETARRHLQGCIAISRQLGDKSSIANALHNLGNVAWSKGEYPEAKSCYQESLSLRQETGDKWAVATSLNNLGSLALNQGDYETAKVLYEQSLSIRQEQGDLPGVASVRDNLGIVAWNRGDFPAAQKLHEDALAYRREIGDRPGIATTLCNLGNVFWQQGKPEAAQARYEESLSLRRAMGNRRGIAMSLDALALSLAACGDIPAAIAACRESLEIRQAIGDHQGCAYSLLVLANLASHSHPGDAAWLASAAKTAFKVLGAGIQKYYLAIQDQTVRFARQALGDQEFGNQWDAGKRSSLDQALEYALDKVK